MLRLFALALLLANVGYYVWSGGWLRSWGLAPGEEGEPQHWAQQIAPEALRIVPAPGAAPAPAPVPAAPAPQEGAAQDPGRSGAGDAPPGAAAPGAAAPGAALVAAPAVLLARTVTQAPVAAASGECRQAGPFEPAQAQAWRQAAKALPEGSWRLESSPVPGRWMIYMGRFADTDVLAKKRVELRIRKVAFDRTNNPALEPGLSLGRFSSEEAAQRGLASLTSRGVRSARVLQERAESEVFTLRLPLVDAALQAQLHSLQGALAGKPLRPCF